ncbi:MAG: lipoprotein ABC transporter permease [Microbacteriaceae bacterium]
MSRGTRVADLLREVASTARAQPVMSLVAVLLSGALSAAVLLTAGGTDANQRSVLASIDSAGTRSIIVSMDTGAGVGADVIERLSDIPSIAWAGGFGSAVDAKNSALGSAGVNVPVRRVWTDDLGGLGIPDDGAQTLTGTEAAWASSEALTQLGLGGAYGAITADDGRGLDVAGRIAVPSYLDFLEPLVLSPQTTTSDLDLATLVVIARQPAEVEPLTALISSLLDPADASKVTIRTSESFARLRALVDEQLSSSSWSLVVTLFGLTGLLTFVVNMGLVIMRRKDFGRRRALGATKGLIVALMVAQAGALAALGAVLGIGASLACLLVAGAPLASPSYTLALGWMCVAVGIVSSLLPGLAAARREPIRELRVP